MEQIENLLSTYSYYKDVDIKSIEVLEYEGDFLELWKYRPLIGNTGMVDKLSLYLALKDDPDIDIGLQCEDPYHCSFWEYCTKHIMHGVYI